MTSSIDGITFDCADPVVVANFWLAALNYVVYPGTTIDADGAAIIPADGRGPRILFQVVPEGKTVKNRVHPDLKPHDSMDAEVARLVALGARQGQTFRESYGTWTVMYDPEGNEFCVERGPEDRRGDA